MSEIGSSDKIKIDASYAVLGEVKITPSDTSFGFLLEKVTGASGIDVWSETGVSGLLLVLGGAPGVTGPQGAQGPEGATGDIGSQGDTGPNGTQGPAGYTGPEGPTGSQGPGGDTGAIGAQGDTGPVGSQGDAGVEGPTGALGPEGSMGPQGNPAPTGLIPYESELITLARPLSTMDAATIEREALCIATSFGSWTGHATSPDAIYLTGGTGYDGASSSCQIITAGVSGSPYIELTGQSINQTGLVWEIALKVDNRAGLLNSGMYFEFDAGNSALTTFGRWYLDDAYGASIQTIFENGQWCKLCFPMQPHYTETSFTSTNIQRLRIRIYDRVGGGTTVLIGRVSLISDQKWLYPLGCGTIFLDGSHESAYTLAKPIMDALNLRGTLMCVGDLENTAGFLTTAELNEFRDDGWDVCILSPTLAIWTSTFPVIDYATLVSALQTERARYIAAGWNADFVAYPKGAFSIGGATDAKVAVQAAGFRAARTIWSNVNSHFPPCDLYTLRAKTIAGGVTTAAQIAIIAAQISAGPGMLGFVFNDIVTGTPSTQDECNVNIFGEMLDRIRGTGVKLLPLSEILP
jgi:hypothetical protein